MKQLYLCVALVAVVSVAGSACSFERISKSVSPTGPSQSGGTSQGPGLMGTWSSGDAATPGFPANTACGNFVWNIATQTATTVQGTFSASCQGGITVAGTASGVLSGNTVMVTASGNGVLPGIPSCPVTLTSAGTIDGESIQFPYTATTCLGPYSGTQTLRRGALPIPTPPPPGGGAPSCAIRDGEDLVDCVAHKYPEKLAAGVSLDQRVANMEFLRNRIIEGGICGGLDLAWNLKRGVGPHSIDAIAWRVNGRDEVVDLGQGYDDTSRALGLQWIIVAGPPGYDPYTPRPTCR